MRRRGGSGIRRGRGERHAGSVDTTGLGAVGIGTALVACGSAGAGLTTPLGRQAADIPTDPGVRAAELALVHALPLAAAIPAANRLPGWAALPLPVTGPGAAGAAAAGRARRAFSRGVGVVLHGAAVSSAIAHLAGATIRAGSSLRIAALPVVAPSRRGMAERGRGTRHTRAGIGCAGERRCRRGAGHAGPVLADLPRLLAGVADVVGPTDFTEETAIVVGAAPARITDPVACPRAGRTTQLFPITGAVTAGPVATLRLPIRTAVGAALGVAGRTAAVRATWCLVARAPGNGRGCWRRGRSGGLGRGARLGRRRLWPGRATPGRIGVPQHGAGSSHAAQAEQPLQQRAPRPPLAEGASQGIEPTIVHE
jgi:hypothetical protein